MIVDGRNSQVQQVIPRWMSYAKALREGELGKAVLRASGPEQLPHGLALEMIAFRKNPHPRHATLLFEKLFLLDFPEATKEVAKYVVESRSIQKPIRAVASNLLLGANAPHDTDIQFRERVRIQKTHLRSNPRNGLRWVELARCYTVLQQYEKADEALRIALNLNPTDRYTVRSAIRFLVHVDERLRAANIIKPDIGTIDDPWLLGAGLSALLLAGKSPRKRITIDPKNISDERIYDWSEYLSALGMLAVRDGKNSAKNLFRTAWKDPSGNVTTHAEWVSRTIFPSLRNEALSFSKAAPEARARVAYSQGDWNTMYCCIEEWKLEEPYSKRPYRFHASTANILGKHLDAIRVIEDIENQGGSLDFAMLANKTYALLCLGQLEDAAKVLINSEPMMSTAEERTVFVANAGLFRILSGEPDQGLELYDRAERLATEVSEDFRSKVFINRMLAKSWMELKSSEKERERLRDYQKMYTDMDSLQLFKAIEASAPTEIQKLKASLSKEQLGGFGKLLRETTARFLTSLKSSTIFSTTRNANSQTDQ